MSTYREKINTYISTKYNKAKKWWEGLSQKHKYIYGGGVAAVLLLVILVGVNLIALGIQSSNATIEVITADTQEPIENAEVKINDKTIMTDIEGKAIFSNLSNRLYEVNISHQSSSSITTEIKVSRGSTNLFVIALGDTKVGNITGKVESSNGILINDGLSIRAGDTSSEVDEDGSFELRAIPTDTTVVTIESPRYADRQITVELNAQLTELGTIILAPAYDYPIKVVDFISKIPVSQVTASYGESEFLTNQDGEVIVKDILLESVTPISIAKTNFVTKTIKPEPGQVDNQPTSNENLTNFENAQRVELSPNGRVLYTSERDGGSSVYSAYYDGSDEIKINAQGPSSTGQAIRPTFSNTGDIVFYSLSSDSNTPRIFKAINAQDVPVQINAPSEVESPENLIVQEYYYLKSEKKLRYTHQIDKNKTTIKLELAEPNNQELTTVYETSFENTKIITELRSFRISSSGNTVNFVESESNRTPFQNIKSVVHQYEVTSKTLKPLETIVTESTALTVMAVSTNSEYVVLSDILPSGVNQVKVVNTSSSIKVPYDNLNIFNQYAQISYDAKHLYFLSVRDGKSDIYRLEFQTGDVLKVTEVGAVSSFYIDKNNVLQYQIEQDMYLRNMNLFSLHGPVMTPISSNFEMWLPDNLT